MPVLKECIEALGENALILSKKEADIVSDLFGQAAPFDWARIDWSQVTKKISINSLDQIFPALKELLQRNFDSQVYLLWNEASLPVIKTDLQSILSHFEDVIYVGRETWLYNPYEEYAIEILRGSGEINVGLFPPRPQPIKPEPINSIAELEKIASDIIIANPQQVATYKTGNKKLLSFFMGEGMKKTNKMANAQILQKIFERLLY